MTEFAAGSVASKEKSVLTIGPSTATWPAFSRKARVCPESIHTWDAPRTGRAICGTIGIVADASPTADEEETDQFPCPTNINGGGPIWLARHITSKPDVSEKPRADGVVQASSRVESRPVTRENNGLRAGPGDWAAGARRMLSVMGQSVASAGQGPVAAAPALSQGGLPGADLARALLCLEPQSLARHRNLCGVNLRNNLRPAERLLKWRQSSPA